MPGQQRRYPADSSGLSEQPAAGRKWQCSLHAAEVYVETGLLCILISLQMALKNTNPGILLAGKPFLDTNVQEKIQIEVQHQGGVMSTS